jgi:hypothetical protein
MLGLVGVAVGEGRLEWDMVIRKWIEMAVGCRLRWDKNGCGGIALLIEATALAAPAPWELE